MLSPYQKTLAIISPNIFHQTKTIIESSSLIILNEKQVQLTSDQVHQFLKEHNSSRKLKSTDSVEDLKYANSVGNDNLSANNEDKKTNDSVDSEDLKLTNNEDLKYTNSANNEDLKSTISANNEDLKFTNSVDNENLVSTNNEDLKSTNFVANRNLISANNEDLNSANNEDPNSTNSVDNQDLNSANNKFLKSTDSVNNEDLKSALTSRPVHVLIIGGLRAVSRWLELIGQVDQANCISVLYGSGDVEAASRDVRFFFPGTLLDYRLGGSAREYLSQTLKEVLVKGLVNMSKERPEDPVLWLGMWLLENRPHEM